jgi:O-antigen ligase
VDLSPRADRFTTSSAFALAGVMIFAVLAFAGKERWAETGIQLATFALGISWLVRWIIAPYDLQCCVQLIPLGTTVLWGLVQLTLNKSVYRFVTWNAVLSWSTYFVLFLLALQIFSNRNVAKLLFRCALYFGTGLSVLSVLQRFSSQGKIYWIFPTISPIALGPFANRDHYAAFVELLLPLAILEALRDRRGWSQAIIVGVMYGSVIATASRAGAFLATLELVSLPLIAAHRSWIGGRGIGRKLIVMGAMVMFFSTLAGWQDLWGRFHTDPFKYRREMWVSAWQMTREHPWLGFGLGTWETAYPAYALFDAGAVVNHAHNDWAEWTAEGGIPFLLMLASVVVLTFRPALRSLWGLGPMVVLMHSFVDFPMQTPAIAAWVFVFLAAVAARERSKGLDGQAQALVASQ